jgi:hypothetical protein
VDNGSDRDIPMTILANVDNANNWPSIEYRFGLCPTCHEPGNLLGVDDWFVCYSCCTKWCTTANLFTNVEGAEKELRAEAQHFQEVEPEYQVP